MTYRLLLALCLLPVLCVAQENLVVSAGAANERSTLTLSSEADYIVVAQVRNLTGGVGVVHADLLVQRQIKGDIIIGDDIIVDCPVDLDLPLPETAGSPLFSLWFLTQDKQGHFTALPPTEAAQSAFFHYLLPVAKAAPANLQVPNDANLTPTERVAIELAAAIKSATGIASDRLISIGTEQPESPSIKSLFQDLAKSESLEARGTGISGLVFLGDPAGFSMIAQDESLKAQSSSANSRIASAICRSSVVDEDLTPTLIELTQNSTPALAQCAAYTLRRIHGRSSLPALAALLDHMSADVRYDAVMGLASFALNLKPHGGPVDTASMDWLTPLPGAAPYRTPEVKEYMPTKPSFLANEARYINYWRHWWSTHHAELTR